MFVPDKIIYFKRNQFKLFFLPLFGGKIAKLNKKRLSIVNFIIHTFILSALGMLLYLPNTQLLSSNVIISLSGHSFVIEVWTWKLGQVLFETNSTVLLYFSINLMKINFLSHFWVSIWNFAIMYPSVSFQSWVDIKSKLKNSNEIHACIYELIWPITWFFSYIIDLQNEEKNMSKR